MNLPFLRTWWIEPGGIIGGRYPGTANPHESQKMQDDLLAMGVRVFVNLQQPDERGRDDSLFPDYRPVVASLAAERGIAVTCHRFPIPDCGVPSVQTMIETWLASTSKPRRPPI